MTDDTTYRERQWLSVHLMSSAAVPGAVAKRGFGELRTVVGRMNGIAQVVAWVRRHKGGGGVVYAPGRKVQPVFCRGKLFNAT